MIMLDSFVFPLLLVCGVFGAFILLGIGISYVSLRWFYAEMAKCPECGRRGAGEFLDAEVVDSNSRIETKNTSMRRGGTPAQRVRITETTHNEHYRCEFCGHEWEKITHERKTDPIDS
jgi:DNA-directed RNA polymerase subunit RPC12/RpoP